ncbi:ExbD/TolR family protein [Anaerosinus massiliensis]|uniref:ExbD/TolR family protein n=1 Tax=Massilibacillus massiliensis TaxID=1806837 RepID=UPI000AA462DE|nr:biopolymer transporter ExbD [Massilibacillus massiliensis]
MKIRSLQSEEQPALMIIPMIDIIFFLLVFFMMSMLSMVEQKSIALTLPAAESAQVNTAKTIPITITKEGQVYWERDAISINELEKKLVLEKRENKEVSVILRGDEASSYGKIVRVMDTVKKVGIAKVSIATDSQ